MSDRYDAASDITALPPEVQAILAKDPSAYTAADHEMLVRFLTTQGPSLDPAMARVIGAMIGATADIPVAPLAAATSPDAGGPFHPPWSNPPGTPTLDWANTILGGVSDNSPFVVPPAAAASLPAAPTSPPAALPTQADVIPVDPNQFGDGRSVRDQAPFTPEGTNTQVPSPTQTPDGSQIVPPSLRGVQNYSAHDRQNKRENWKSQARIVGLGPASAFANVDPAMLGGYAADPEMASYLLAGQDPTRAAMIAPEVQAAMELSQQGFLGGGANRRGLGGPESAGAQLAQTEAFVNSLGPGQYIDPGSVYRAGLKRSRHTDVADMYAGQGQPGDLQNQIATTIGAMLAGSDATMTPDAKQNLSVRLKTAAKDWLVLRSQGGSDISFPEYLRSIKAQRWVGRGISY